MIQVKESIDIKVEIILYDAEQYASDIVVHICDNQSILVNVTATGIGCSIIFEPPIFPIFDMGYLFR